jgi:K+/H+ antiporter YhaU regulatory subunit KhtT
MPDNILCRILRWFGHRAGWTMGNLRKIKKALRHQHPGPARPPADGGVETMDLDRQELEAILEHAKTALSEEEYTKLHAALETLVFLTTELEKKRVSVQRLKQLLFGATTEKTQKVIQKVLAEAGVDSETGGDDTPGQSETPPEKVPGHGV